MRYRFFFGWIIGSYSFIVGACTMALLVVFVLLFSGAWSTYIGEEINFNSSFCDFKNVHVTKCYLNDTTQEHTFLASDGAFKPDYNDTKEIQIFMASTIYICDVCFAITRIFNATAIKTCDATDRRYISGKVGCRTSLFVTRSNIEDLSNGIQNLHIVSSSVQHISLSRLTNVTIQNSTLFTVESLSWEENGIFRDSVVTSALSMNGYNTHIIGCYLEKFRGSFYGKHLKVVDTFISIIPSYSWKVESQEFILENVRITDIRTLGLAVLSEAVTLRNVTFHSMKFPFMSISATAKLVLESVTYDGVPVLDNATTILRGNYPVPRLSVDLSQEECFGEQSILKCNFILNEGITYFLDRKVMKNFETIEIANCRNLEVDRMSNNSLYLVNSTVKFFNYKVERCPECQANLFTRNTIMISDIPEGFNTLYLDSSTAQRIKVNRKTKSLMIFHSAIRSFSANIGNGSVVSIFKAKIQTLEPSVFYSPVSIIGTTINKIESIQLNHPGDSSHFSGNLVGEIKTDGLTIFNGVLHYNRNNVKLSKGPFIHAHLQGQLTLSLQRNFVPVKVFPFITAHSYSQVSITSNGFLEPWSKKKHFVKVSSQNSLSTVFPKDIVITEKETEFCDVFTVDTMLCDFTDKPQETVHVFLQRSSRDNDPHTLIIRNPKKLFLYPSCAHTIVLDRVQSGEILMERAECKGSLRVHNSTFESVYAQTTDVMVTESTIGQITLISKDFFIHQSKIDSVKGILSSKGSLVKSDIKLVEKWKVLNSLALKESRIDLLSSYGLIGAPNSNIMLDKMSIGLIEQKGIVTEGSMTIRDSVIDEFEFSGIYLNGGELYKENVAFIKSDNSMVFVNTSRINSVQCTNFTMNGEPFPCGKENPVSFRPWKIQFPYEMNP